MQFRPRSNLTRVPLLQAYPAVRISAPGILQLPAEHAARGNRSATKWVIKGLNPVKYWPHWSAILKEKESGQKYAVDRWPFDQGENATVVKVEDWYIKDTK